MQHINIEAVEAKAAEFEAFAASGVDVYTTADYAARAANLRDFAKSLRAHRAIG